MKIILDIIVVYLCVCLVYKFIRYLIDKPKVKKYKGKVFDDTKEYYLEKHLYKNKYYIDVYFQNIKTYIMGIGGVERYVVIEVFDLDYNKLYYNKSDHFEYESNYKKFIEDSIGLYEFDKRNELKHKLALEELKNMGCGSY